MASKTRNIGRQDTLEFVRANITKARRLSAGVVLALEEEPPTDPLEAEYVVRHLEEILEVLHPGINQTT